MFTSNTIQVTVVFVSGGWTQFGVAQCDSGLTGCVQVSPFYSKLNVTAERSHGFSPHALLWNKNSLDQDPCTVDAMLNASCRGLGKISLSPHAPSARMAVVSSTMASTEHAYPPPNNGQYRLPSRTNYSDELRCGCNTVMTTGMRVQISRAWSCVGSFFSPSYMARASCQGDQIYS